MTVTDAIFFATIVTISGTRPNQHFNKYYLTAVPAEDGAVVVEEPEEYHIASTLALNEQSNNNKTYQVSAVFPSVCSLVFDFPSFFSCNSQGGILSFFGFSFQMFALF